MFFKQCAIITLVSMTLIHGSTAVNFSLSASSGNKNFDLTLNSINAESQKSMPGFYGAMNLHFGTTPNQLDYLIFNKGLSPADAFMVLRFSLLIGKPVDTVLKTYTTGYKKGWGAMAKELGIKPGSAEFHQLKKGGIAVLEESRKQSGISLDIQVGKSPERKKQSGPKKNNKDKGNGKR